MAPQALIDDALAMMAAFIEKDHDALSLALASKAVFQLALPRLFADVHLVSSKHQLQFSRMILQDSRLGQHIHGLTIEGGRRWYKDGDGSWISCYRWGDSEDALSVADSVSKLIRASPRLHYLTTNDEKATSYYRLHPAVNEAITTCTSLVSIRTDRETEFLDKLRAPLREITLRSPSSWYILNRLVNFTETLEKATLQPSNVPRLPTRSEQWPRVRQLTLWYTAPPLVDLLERAFPSLAILSFEGQTSYHDTLFEELEDKPHICTVWSTLAQLHGHLIGIFALALSGVTVGMLDISDKLDRQVAVRVAKQAVARLQPTMLRVCVSVELRLLQSFFERGASRLTALDLNMSGPFETLHLYEVNT